MKGHGLSYFIFNNRVPFQANSLKWSKARLIFDLKKVTWTRKKEMKIFKADLVIIPEAWLHFCKCWNHTVLENHTLQTQVVLNKPFKVKGTLVLGIFVCPFIAFLISHDAYESWYKVPVRLRITYFQPSKKKKKWHFFFWMARLKNFIISFP